MKIRKAIKCVIEGKSVTRPGWDWRLILEKSSDSIYKQYKPDHPEKSISEENNTNWLPTPYEILADDWCVE